MLSLKLLLAEAGENAVFFGVGAVTEVWAEAALFVPKSLLATEEDSASIFWLEDTRQEE